MCINYVLYNSILFVFVKNIMVSIIKIIKLFIDLIITIAYRHCSRVKEHVPYIGIMVSPS